MAEVYTLPYSGQDVEFAIKLATNSIAPAFSTSKTYVEGDTVVYQGLLYAANQAMSAGAWDSTKWDTVKIFDDNGYLILNAGSAS